MRFAIHFHIVLSPALVQIFFSTKKKISFKNILKSNEPNIDSCGTFHVIRIIIRDLYFGALLEISQAVYY